MPGIREIKQKNYIPSKKIVNLYASGIIVFTKLLMFNSENAKKLRTVKYSEERYRRPKPKYKLPKYSEDMKYCKSEEKYLRPTLWCNFKVPTVIALANKLGAYKASDKEFAEKAYNFVKEEICLEIGALNSVEETLKRGTGSCLHMDSAFIALCRCAGIKARYKLFTTGFHQAYYDSLIRVDPVTKMWYDAMGHFLLEGEVEVFLDGRWTDANVEPKAERQAAAGIPVTRLGETSIGKWWFPVPDSFVRTESIPHGVGTMFKLGDILAPGSTERVNVSIQKQIAIGKKIIKEAGGLEEYDRKARSKAGPNVIMKNDIDIFA
jgi:hypothetical protein